MHRAQPRSAPGAPAVARGVGRRRLDSFHRVRFAGLPERVELDHAHRPAGDPRDFEHFARGPGLRRPGAVANCHRRRGRWVLSHGYWWC